MSLYTYSFPEPWHSGKNITGQRINSTLVAVPGVKVEVIYSQPDKTTRTLRNTGYRGDTVPDYYTLSDLVQTNTIKPDRVIVYDTASVDFHKIDCISDMRTVTGLGLKDAKELVEALGMQNATITFRLHW